MNAEAKEVIFNLINCALAAALVFLGGFSTGQFTTQTLIIALVAAMVTFCTQFKDYWEKETDEVTKRKKLMSFL